MQATSRTALRSLRNVRPQMLRQTRRHASESHGHGHAADANEHFGAAFYVVVAAIPATYLFFRLTPEGPKLPWITRKIEEYTRDYKETFERRNNTHMIAIAQAAADRTLFNNEPNRHIRHVDLQYPEQFNHGSPWNVPAGHGYANIDAVIEKYQRQNNARQEEKLRQIKENRVPREQPFEPLTKVVE